MMPALLTRMSSGLPVARNVLANASIDAGSSRSIGPTDTRFSPSRAAAARPGSRAGTITSAPAAASVLAVLSAATTSHDALSAETYGPVISALTMLLAANEKAGTIRSGLEPDDVLLILGFLWRIDPAGDWRAQAGRLLDILMDGLRAGAPTAQPASEA
jgi:hypothetical protein